jgi:NADPH2:quinone reductase
MKKSRTVIYRRFDAEDPAGVFELSEAPVPEKIGPGEILVKISFALVHPCDAACAMGVVNGVELPSIGGLEALGVVARVGSALTDRFAVGQRVHVCGTHVFGNWQTWRGVWQEYALCPPEALIPVPEGVPDDIASQLVVNILTPYAMVKEMGIGPGDILLQTAAGSVLGQVMIQLGQVFGFTTINLVRRQETADMLVSTCGIDTVFVYDGTKASAAAVEIAIGERLAGAPIRFAIEAVSGQTGRFCLDLVGPDAVVYFYGILSGDLIVPVNVVSDLDMKNNTLKGWSIQETWMRKTHDEVKQRYIEELWQLISEGKITTPPLGERFPLEQAGAALKASFERDKPGKVVLDCTGS